MNAIHTWSLGWAACLLAAPGPINPSPPPEPPADRPGANALVGATSFEGSTIVSTATGFQPDLIYRKFPADESVTPTEPWELAFGVKLNTAVPSVNVTLRLDPGVPNPDIQLLDDTAVFVPQQGLYHNYDPLERFEIVYAGPLNPFVGPVDLLLEPEGFAEIPVRVHLNVTDQPGFPAALTTGSNGITAALGDITGDANLEILFPGSFSQQGLHALDHTGNPIPGWPFLNDDPTIQEQYFSTPTLADLDGDGRSEVIVVGTAYRQVRADEDARGIEATETLYALDGSGAIRWEFTADFDGIPSVADLDGDGSPDIVIGAADNLMRFNSDGTLLPAWQAQAQDALHVVVPVLADVDANPGNGWEIVACTPLFGVPTVARVYVWNQDGTLHAPAWPKELDACNTPVAIELDGNRSNGLEVVTGLDHFEDPPVDPDTGFLNTFSVYAWHANGSNASGWPRHFLRDPNTGFADDRILAPFSAGDLDADGNTEIVVGTYGQGDPANGNLFVFHHDGSLAVGWPRWAGVAQAPSAAGGPALADLDGDGLLEVVTGSFLGVYVFRADGQTFEGFPRLTSDVFSQATIADIDNDDTPEIVQFPTFDRLYVWQLLAPVPDPQPWPQFRRDSEHTGAFDAGPTPAIPTLSQAGMFAMLCLLLCAGAYLFRATNKSEPRS